MAEGDESWVMAVLGADVVGLTPNFASFFFPVGSALTELRRPGTGFPWTRVYNPCIYNAVIDSVAPTYSQTHGTHPLAQLLIRMRLRPLQKEGCSCYNQPTQRIDRPVSIGPSEGRTQPESQAINGLQVLSSPLLSPVLPLHLQTIKNYCNGFIDTANMHVRAEAVCILANTAHNAEDCLAIENVIRSQHGSCKWWFSLLQLAAAHVSQQ